ncbi:2210_t:CDS:1, partial [Paraglomus occultum]
HNYEERKDLHGTKPTRIHIHTTQNGPKTPAPALPVAGGGGAAKNHYSIRIGGATCDHVNRE